MPGSSHEPGLGWVSVHLVPASLRHPAPHTEHVGAHSPVPWGWKQTGSGIRGQDDAGLARWLPSEHADLGHRRMALRQTPGCPHLGWASPYLPPRTLEQKEVPVLVEPRAGDTPKNASSSSEPSIHIILTPIQHKRTPCPAGSGPNLEGNGKNSGVSLCELCILTGVRQRPCSARGRAYIWYGCVYMCVPGWA